MLSVVVETKELVETVIASAIAGVGVTVVFSIAIWGAARFVDLNREEKPLAAISAAAVCGLALAATMATVVIGIVVMTGK